MNERVSHGFELRMGDPGDTADGAGNHRRPASQVQTTERKQMLTKPWTSFFFFFPCDTVPMTGLTGQKGKEGLCVFMGILRDFEYLMDYYYHL